MLLRNIPITGSNYKQAWDTLKGRFGNKKMIVTSILKRLFNQKKVVNQSASQIKAILDTTTECIQSLNNLNINTDSWDPIIIFLVGQKLDTESLKDWEELTHKDGSDELSTWSELKKFLEAKFRTLELVTPVTTSTREKPSTYKSHHATVEDGRRDIYQTPRVHVSPVLCTYCKGEHYIFNCKEFVNQSVDARQEFVKKNYLCYNCLQPNHNVYQCKQRKTCRVCGRKHHSLLHKVRLTHTDEDEQPQPEQNITTAHFSREQPDQQVLLATAQVMVKAKNGYTHMLRALIDQGSEATFVSARAAALLGCTKSKINGVVSGVGEGNRIQIQHLVDLAVSSRWKEEDEVNIEVRAYILKTISTSLPSTHIKTNCSELQMLPLADPTYHTPGRIDMLLGADVYCKIIEEGLVKLSDGLVVQKTRLGWIISGRRDEKIMDNKHNIITLHITRMVEEDNDLLRRFWEIETDVYKKKKIQTKEEELCEEIYKNTTRRDSTGRYEVHLPLKQSIEDTIKLCGKTKEQAMRRFTQLEKKFERDEKLKIEYTKVIHEYKAMGHMKQVKNVNNDNAIYLPHHAVIRDDKETTKVRVVFDASAKGSNGYSLNDCMMIGPVLQPDLRSLIIAWRMHKICVVGDIVKMYRMINMTAKHTPLQRILWRDNPHDQIEEYDLTTVTFGTAAAPYLAVRTLIQLADDEVHNYTDTAVIKRAFYMDDLMTGNENIEKTRNMCKEITEILAKGGFQMQKWSSNSEEVLNYLQRNDIDARDKINIKLDDVIRILGLTWDRKDDAFKVSVNLPEMKLPVTKRTILSDVARLFDPFGWLSPVIVTAKILIQRLWLCSLGWDDQLTPDLREEWIRYREQLTHLQNLKIPRWLKTTLDNDKVELHGFADASAQAYAAVTYLRVFHDDKIHVTILASRTKVAPLKQISVPRLELCAAALLAELIEDLVEVLKVPKHRIFAWTDSMVVLSWLQCQPIHLKTFVANRVGGITRVLDNECWRHVKSAENPADIATRGIDACDLVDSEIWWMGPVWLQQTNLQLERCDVTKIDLEMKKLKCNVIIEEKPIWERFSTMSRMKRVLAYCRRFGKKRTTQTHHYLTSHEMEYILEECIRYYQNLVYEKDIEALKKEGRVKKRSTLITLAPFIDERGILRVGGRLQNASLADTTKHPIIIPSHQHITRLLVNEAHTKTLHGGIQLMLTYIRTKYWVIGVKSAVKQCIRNCKICIIDKAKVQCQGNHEFKRPLYKLIALPKDF
ncbi:uncharacterized protein LOC123700724 [Colias croceus]|uniref:uncharacterized protein LOC123700724 n=1 Tax=Colias crocea TaxID=72248 RepID=UPI001E27C889|nr:uncharacterized protein LOC123700724 [Colias croceus]